MMRIFYALVLIFLMNSFEDVRSQNFEWVKSHSLDFFYNPDLLNYSVATDSEGNVYWAGMSEYDMNYSLEAYGSLFFKKMDSEGQVLSEVEAIGTGSVATFKTDSDNNLILIVNILDELVINYLDTLYYDGTSIKSYLVKFDEDLNMVWSKDYFIADNGVFSTLYVDSESNIYVGMGDFIGTRIVKLDEDGEELFEIVQENVGRLSSIAVDSDDNVYVAGSCAGFNALFAGEEFDVIESYNIYVAKYNSDGDAEWVEFVEDITCPGPKILVNENDHLYFVGELFLETTFGDLETSGPDWVYDFFIAGMDTNGEFEWIREVPDMYTIVGDAFVGRSEYVDISPEGNLVFTGFIRGVVDWGDDFISEGIPLDYGFGYDILLLEIDEDGNMVMEKTAGGTGYDKNLTVGCNAQGDIFITGIVTDTAYFDSITLNEQGVNPILAKIGGEDIATDIDNDFFMDDIIIYPNPVTDVINLRLSHKVSLISFKLLNETGQVVLTETNPPNVIQAIGIPKGLYIAEIATEKGIVRKKIIIQ